ncbi:MAG: adenylate kinase family enzyme [Maribacter sp.]|jgi:adenylate kinase family enzyme
MKILLLGNIGSGKTTISTALAEQNSDWEYIAIDDFRKELSDGTIKGDAKAKSVFVKKISHDNDCQIIECTGLGRLGSSVFRRLQKYEGELLVLVLNVSLEICITRIKDRIWDIPFPKNITGGEKLVKKLHKIYHSNFLFERWGLRDNTTFFSISNEGIKEQHLILELMNAFVKNTLVK